MTDILNRKGARKTSDIPAEVITLLHQGTIESVNLIEWQAVDHATLLTNVLPTIGLATKLDFILTALKNENNQTGIKAIRLIGSLLNNERTNETIHFLSHHTSDSVRCWAAFMNSSDDYSLKDKLLYIQPFAADHHFGVREIAWMAIREDLASDVKKSVNLLMEWAQSEDENIRRFSLEAIHPRGVWTKHITLLKEEPHLALPILNLLKSDSSKYVQDSVGNWLNDASKTQPDWVSNICQEWQQTSPTKATERIIKKAQRTLVKTK